MRMIASTITLIIALVLSGCSDKQPVSEIPITDVRSLIDANLKARGGEQALAILAEFQFLGQYVEPDGQVLDMDQTYHLPYHLVHARDFGTDIYMGFNGKTTWWLAPPYGTREPAPIPHEDPRSFMIEYDAPLDGPYRHVASDDLKFQGKSSVRGKDAWQLSVESSDEYLVHHFFDVDTLLEVRRQFVKRNEIGIFTLNYLDHRDIAGTPLPTKIEYWMNGKLMGTFNVAESVVDPEVDQELLRTLAE